jgi:hypothetical protein
MLRGRYGSGPTTPTGRHVHGDALAASPMRASGRAQEVASSQELAAALGHELDTRIVRALFNSEEPQGASAAPGAAASVHQPLPNVLGVSPFAVPMTQPGRPAEPVLLTLRLAAPPPPSAVANCVCCAGVTGPSSTQTLPLLAAARPGDGDGDGTTLVDVWFTPPCKYPHANTPMPRTTAGDPGRTWEGPRRRVFRACVRFVSNLFPRWLVSHLFQHLLATQDAELDGGNRGTVPAHRLRQPAGTSLHNLGDVPKRHRRFVAAQGSHRNDLHKRKVKRQPIVSAATDPC